MSVCKPVVGDGMAVGFGRWVNESRFHVVPSLLLLRLRCRVDRPCGAQEPRLLVAYPQGAAARVKAFLLRIEHVMADGLGYKVQVVVRVACSM